jgi:uncharacterized protein YkwD
MPRTAQRLVRLLPLAAVAAAVLPMAAPASGAAKTRPHVRPVAHIALGLSHTTRARHHGPIAHIALGVVHTDLARRHKRRHRPLRGHASSACAGADTAVGSASPETLRAAVLCLVNDERTSRGLPRLSANSRLDRSAQGWTNTMMRIGNLTHGNDFAARISAVGYDWQTAGENIATGFDTPRAVVAAWMGSPGHCRNILNPSFADIGIGLNAGGIDGSGGATWTQDFGLWIGQLPRSHNTAPMNSCGSGA